MEQYISKSALVSEIERKMNLCKKILLRLRTRQNDDYHQGNIDAYEVVISLLDTLEVKEADSTDAFVEKACNYLFSHMGLFVTFFDDDIVEDIERSEFIKKFRIAMEDNYETSGH